MRLALVLVLAACGACGGDDDDDDDDDTAGATSPAAPSGLEGMPMDDGVHLTWNDESTNEDEFVIERDDGDGFVEVAREPFDSEQHHDSPVPSGSHDYRVSAVNETGSSPSAAITVELP